MTARAKFYCSAEVSKKWGLKPELTTRTFEFTAVYDASTPENERFTKATPTGTLTMQVDNPNVSFKPGTYYYLDITPAE